MLRLFQSYLAYTGELKGRHGVMDLFCDHSLSKALSVHDQFSSVAQCSTSA